jgi:hypothetical protein
MLNIYILTGRVDATRPRAAGVSWVFAEGARVLVAVGGPGPVLTSGEVRCQAAAIQYIPGTG